jgi:type I restriction enzyme, R subunit
VLFASALIDYDYIMGLIAASMGQTTKVKMTREEIIRMIKSDAGLIDRHEDLEDYINSLNFKEGLSEQAVREGFQTFVAGKNARILAAIAQKHDLQPAALQTFVDEILFRMIFDGSQLSDLLAPLALGWKARTQKELALMEDLVPLLKKLAQGREISGLAAYE